MEPSAEHAVFEQMLTPVVRCFTPEVAERIVSLRASPRIQTRLDELARKANEGELTQEERSQYEEYVEAIDVISILQAKARKIIAREIPA